MILAILSRLATMPDTQFEVKFLDPSAVREIEICELNLMKILNLNLVSDSFT